MKRTKDPADGGLPGDSGIVQAQSPRIQLHRRVCIIGRDRIEVRPSRSAILMPATGLCLSVAALTAIGFYINSLPFGLLTFLLLLSVVILPFSAMGLVYSVIGANVIFDRRKQSALWQQGILGLGIGTQELVPFWKISEILVQEAGHDEEAEGLQPLEELAQWEIVLVKTNGKRLVVGNVTVPRSEAKTGQTVALQIGDAIVKMTGAALRVEAPEPVTREEGDWDAEDQEEG